MALSFPNLPLSEPPRPEKLKRPRAKVQAIDDDRPATEWASLLADLARPSDGSEVRDRPVQWRVHDKTHIEFAIDYPFGEAEQSYTWEAFFFVPESFRLDEKTYEKKQIYDDLLSYVRLAVPDVPFETLHSIEHEDKRKDGGPGDPVLARLERRLRQVAKSPDRIKAARRAIRSARVFACLVRASGLRAQRAMLATLDTEICPDERAQLAVARFASACERVTSAYRDVLTRVREMGELPEQVAVATEWVDEDVSLVVEALTATASVQLQKGGRLDPGWSDLAARLAAQAVAEARYRRDRGFDSVGFANARPRDIEHLEFRRHVLKRFTSSVLWLSHEVRDATVWVVHVLYAVAAALAMAFAVVVSIRALQMQELLLPYVTLLVVSYAIKDRMKAVLQQKFSRWADKRFPDRRWTIRDREREENVGEVVERAGFRPFDKLPADVLETRRLTRSHTLEESARPERVLWHEKQVKVTPRKPGMLRSPMLTEIFRLNLAPWLQHTDDPNRKMTFADPDDASVYAATARRVYNLSVVYRMRRPDGELAPWRRIRVVVSRKGIERIDEIV